MTSDESKSSIVTRCYAQLLLRELDPQPRREIPLAGEPIRIPGPANRRWSPLSAQHERHPAQLAWGEDVACLRNHRIRTYDAGTEILYRPLDARYVQIGYDQPGTGLMQECPVPVVYIDIFNGRDHGERSYRRLAYNALFIRYHQLR